MKIAYNSADMNFHGSSLVIWKETRRHFSRQRMDSPAACATIRAMPTADKSNHSAAGTLHPHCTDGHTITVYTALNFPAD